MRGPARREEKGLEGLNILMNHFYFQKSLYRVGCFVAGLVIFYALFVRIVMTSVSDNLLKDMAALLPGVILIGGVFLIRKRRYKFDFAVRICREANQYYLFAVALALRLLWVFISDVRQVSDFSVYESISRNIYNGGSFFDPSYFRPTGPSIVFAASYRIFGENPLSPLIVLAILGAITVLALYQIVLAITGSKERAALAGFLLAFWPSHVIYSVLLGTDTIFCFCIVVSLLFFVLSTKQTSNTKELVLLVLSGIFIGLSNWVRGTAPLFIFSWVLCVFIYYGNVRRKILKAMCLSAGFLVVILPILIHNYTHLNVLSLSMQRMSGWSMMMGVNLECNGGYNGKLAKDVNEEAENNIGRSDGECFAIYRDDLAKKKAEEIVKRSPLPVICMGLTSKIAEFVAKAESTIGWSISTSRYSYSKGFMLVWLINNALYVLLISVAGLVLLQHSLSEYCVVQPVLLCYIGAFLLSVVCHMVLEVQPRYHHMFIPLFITLVACSHCDRLNNADFTHQSESV
jgi:4-amino-4-deoxy-L-arabinose transferase-like glycosyltransferase